MTHPQIVHRARFWTVHRDAALFVAVALAAAACTRPRLPIAPLPAPEPVTGPGAAPPRPERSADADVEYLRSRQLAIPVAGVRAAELVDSFDGMRDGGRRHRAIDILAPRGTPVLAADAGKVLRASWNNAGGNTVYTIDEASRVVYYYAHLDHYRDSLVAGMPIARGDTIGFVGTTGNAPRDIPHLHFQVMRVPRDGKYWNGEPLNPFGLFREQQDKAEGGGKP